MKMSENVQKSLKKTILKTLLCITDTLATMLRQSLFDKKNFLCFALRSCFGASVLERKKCGHFVWPAGSMSAIATLYFNFLGVQR